MAVDTCATAAATDVWGRNEVSDPEVAIACYDRANHSLYCQATEHSRHWPAIARELAQALGVDGEAVGAVASGFRDVLSANTLEDAARRVSQYFFDDGWRVVAEP